MRTLKTINALMATGLFAFLSPGVVNAEVVFDPSEAPTNTRVPIALVLTDECGELGVSTVEAGFGLPQFILAEPTGPQGWTGGVVQDEGLVTVGWESPEPTVLSEPLLLTVDLGLNPGLEPGAQVPVPIAITCADGARIEFLGMPGEEPADGLQLAPVIIAGQAAVAETPASQVPTPTVRAPESSTTLRTYVESGVLALLGVVALGLFSIFIVKSVTKE